MQIMRICNVMSAWMLNAAARRVNVLATLVVKTTSSAVYACGSLFTTAEVYPSATQLLPNPRLSALRLRV